MRLPLPMPASERCVAVALHDVAPATWPLYAPLLTALDDWRVPLTLLVVPWWHGGQRVTQDGVFRAAMDARLRRGDEIALHGWRHLDEAVPPVRPAQRWRRRVLTPGKGEFAALGSAVSRFRIAASVAAFAGCGWCAEGFVAPAWQLSPAAANALRGHAFAYTSNRDALWWLPGQRRLASPAWWRGPARRCGGPVARLERRALALRAYRDGAARRYSSARLPAPGRAALVAGCAARGAGRARGRDQGAVGSRPGVLVLTTLRWPLA